MFPDDCCCVQRGLRSRRILFEFTRAASRARALAHSFDERRDNEKNLRRVLLLIYAGSEPGERAESGSMNERKR